MCNVRQTATNTLVENQVIDTNTRKILNNFKFKILNEELTENASRHYGLKTNGELLFNEVSPTRQADPNDRLIGYNRFDKYYDLNDKLFDELQRLEDLQVSNNIEPGVQELFESNPELANAVYEALGYNQIITPNDKIVFGHPGLGKTYLKESGRTDIIDFDSDYKTKINEKFNLPKGFKARNDFQKSNKEEYQKAVRELWIEAKQEVKKTGKQLFASDMILLREFASDFDKVITMSKDTFINRAKQRNDYTSGETESWKNSLDIEISKLDKSKIFNTDKYLSDLFITPQQKQQTQQLYSQYLEQNPNGSVEQFKSWVDEFNSIDKKDYSLIKNITSLKEGDFIQEGSSVAKIINIDEKTQSFDFVLIDDLNNVEKNNYNWYKDFFETGKHKIKKASKKNIEKFIKSEQILKTIYDKNKNVAKSTRGSRFIANFLGNTYTENKKLTDYLNNTEKINSLDVLTIIENTDNEFKYVAKIIKDVIISNNYEIDITQNDSKEGVAGDYIDGKINMYIPFNDSQYTRVIIHELLHAISDNNVFQFKIDKLYNYVTKFLKDNNIDYGLKNNKEFLAEIFSNKTFQELMAQLEYTEPNQNKKLSVLDKFLELLSSFFKIENNSVLKEAFLILEDITKYNNLNSSNKNQDVLWSKKINELSNFISQKSQEKLNQIQDIFNENPELSKIGTVEQYSQYLDTIFPDSKVKDIVYHGTKYRAKLYNGKPLVWFNDINDNEAYFIYEDTYDIKNKIRLSYEDYEKLPQYRFEKFKKKEHRYAGGDTFLGTGIYFTTSKEDANKGYNREGLYSVIINVKNPYTENKGYSNSRSGKGSQELIDKGYDSVTEKINNGQEYNVFEPEQIHILGSKQDIEGFKEFVRPNNAKPGEQLTLFSDEEIIEQLVQENKLKRKC